MRNNGRTNNKGKYTPKNPEKYVGKLNNIIWRSSWEREFFKFLDNNANVLKWASEEIGIPYLNAVDNKVHTYYPDIWMQYKNKNGDLITEIIEIKPKEQIEKPKVVGKSKKTQLYEQLTYIKNVSKWKYAQAFCDKQGIKFRLVSEMEIFSK